jgi:hypothetical protein
MVLNYLARVGVGMAIPEHVLTEYARNRRRGDLHSRRDTSVGR